MNQCPINYYMDNLIFNQDRSVWAAFKIKGFEYDFLDMADKKSILYSTARFLAGILSDAQVLIIPAEQNNKEHFRKLRKGLRKTDPLYEVAFSHAVGVEEYLANINNGAPDVNDYAFYIIAKLSENTDYEIIQGIKEAWQYFLKDAANAVNIFLNKDTFDILGSKVDSCKKMAKKWFDSQEKKLEIAEVRGEELQWLLRRPAFRGLKEPVNLFYANQDFGTWHPGAEEYELKKEQIMRPYRKDISSLFSGTIKSDGRTLIVDHGNHKTSYQTFLIVTNVPDEWEYPGCEWLYMAQQYNIQAEICLHIHAVEHRESIKKIDNKRMEITSQMRNAEDVNQRVPEELQEGLGYSDFMEAEIKAMRAPLFFTTMSICLSADNREELEEKVITIKNAYEDIHFVLERPLTDQEKLYLNHIPSMGNRLLEFQRSCTPLMIASGVIGAVHELGDKEGPFIGTTGIERKQVFLDLGRACLLNKSASATFYGDLGCGKSFNANILITMVVLYGGYGLIIDPKGERKHWEKKFALFQGLITSVEISNKPEYWGKLDPFVMYRDDVDAATELAHNVIMELNQLKLLSDEDIAVKEVLNIMKQKWADGARDLSMTLVIQGLKKIDVRDPLYKAAQGLARSMELDRKIGLSGLLYGNGSEEAIEIDNRLNIIMTQNLILPSPETAKTDYTAEERLSTVIMSVIGNFAKKFALKERNFFSCVLMDESWAFGKTAEGVKLIDFLTRMGRSLYTGVILNGHSVLDLPTESIRNTITYKFCFHTSNDGEASRMCNYLHIADSQENRDTLMNLGNGQCMFRDLDGHVGILDFDAVYQDIIDVFKTTPMAYDAREDEMERAAQMEEDLLQLEVLEE